MDYSQQIERARKDHEDALTELWRLIKEVKQDTTLDTQRRTEYLSALYSRLSTKDLKSFFIGDSQKYKIGVSFRSSIAKTRRFKAGLRRYGWNIAPGSNSKARDRAFGERLGIPVPETLADNIGLEHLPIAPNTILKPVSGAGARGVMHIDPSRRLHSVLSGRTYDSVAEASAEMRPANRLGAPTRWSAEEAVLGADGELANDMKVYMFYGEPGIYLEIARRAGARGHDLYAVHDAAHRPISLGPKVRSFEGNGVPDDVLDKARRISLASPVAFLRVDFHMGATECVLGEITPHPGGTYAGSLHDDVDRYLGELFVEAEARLFVDMLGSKKFEAYQEVYQPESGTER